ncbi:MAG: hypothetical protein GYB66_05690 [Chloroflexi bacterium]|nr:hypothetical protein [Chloroflexota bacterium]
MKQEVEGARPQPVQQPAAQTADTSAYEVQAPSRPNELASPATPPEDLTDRLRRLSPAARHRSVTSLQRSIGNRAVRRMLSPPANVVQRAAMPTGEKHTIKGLSEEFDINKPIGRLPFELKSVTIEGGVEYEIISPDQPESDTEARGGAVSGPDAAGVQGEVTKKWKEWGSKGDQVTLSSKGEAELTTDGGKLGVTILGLETKHTDSAIKFTLIDWDAEKSEISLVETDLEFALQDKSDQYTTPDGRIIVMKFFAKAILTIDIDEKRVGRWIGQRFLQLAASEVALAGAFVAGGVMTLAAAWVTMGLGKEVAAMVDEAVMLTDDYCASYAAVFSPTPMYVGSTDWGAQGWAAGWQFFAKTNAPPEAIREAARKRNLHSEAFAVAWPKVKDMMYKRYREKHYIEWWVYGEKGPGYRDLKRLLEGDQHLRFKNRY